MESLEEFFERQHKNEIPFHASHFKALNDFNFLFLVNAQMQERKPDILLFWVT